MRMELEHSHIRAQDMLGCQRLGESIGLVCNEARSYFVVLMVAAL